MQTLTKEKTKAKGRIPTGLYNDGLIWPKVNPVYCDAAYSSFGDKGVIIYREVIRIYCENKMKH